MKLFALTLVFALLVVSVAQLSLINLAGANFFPYGVEYVPPTFAPYITILADGNITGPNLQCINCTGNYYRLTSDLQSCAINIECSNIVFDGAGHNITIVKDSNAGVLLSRARNVTVKNLELHTSVWKEIFVLDSQYCHITGITGKCIALINSSFNTIDECTSGVELYNYAAHNLIIRNNLTELSAAHTTATFNCIYGNNMFCEPYIQRSNSGTIQYWDNGSLGNYWSHYSTKYPNGSELDKKGVYDTPYVISKGNIDCFPLVYNRKTPELTVFCLENAVYASGFPLNFTVDKATGWIGYSLDGHANVTVTGNVTVNGLASGFHNLTVYATDLYGIGGVSKTVTFTVTNLFPTIIVIVLSVSVSLLLCVAYVQKRRSHTMG
ncbi:MAG: hypothetical protein NWE92_10520 [Candidatus Bathyarchaeota archaeon]|nr:hypothetical protein [Candidatus Bathyarchaeota archaeon]